VIATFVGFSELLLSQDWPPEKQREYLETMHDEGLRVSQFLNELLDLQRLEAGATAISLRPTDLTSLLRFAVDVAAHDPSHPVTLDLPREGVPMALAEPDRIQQVLANLLSNARKYSPHGGPIRLKARVAKDAIEVSVEDAGVGIPPDAVDQVFQKFYRVESQSHRGIRGTGIGLAICREIVEAHGGRIWAESAGLGRGTRVTFSVPVATLRRAPPGSRLSSRGEHVTARQRNDRDTRRLPGPAAAQPPRNPRAILLTSHRPPANGRRS
jgi:signal transduction histidine kinase